PPANEDPNPLPGWLLNKLNSVTQLELARSTRRLAKQKQRIVFQEIALPQFVQVSSPPLKGRHFVDVGDIAQQSIRVHLNIAAGLHQSGQAWISPVSPFPWRG